MTQYFEEYQQHVKVDKELDGAEELRAQLSASEADIQGSLARYYLTMDIVVRRTIMTTKQITTRIQDHDLAAVFHNSRWYILIESLEDSGYVE